jgi:signal transduction histidine kinase/ligand-binding sensor domain-containing protein
MKHLTLTILIALIAIAGLAQPKKIAFEKYSVAEGLPEEFVAGLIQDDKGFIWAATQNGLVKYDGYQFKVYKASSDTSHTTQLQITNLLGGLLIAKNGKIWMGGYSPVGVAIASFDPVSEQFRNYFLPQINQSNRFGGTILYQEDATQNIWFANFLDDTGSSLVANLCILNPIDCSIKVYPELLLLNFSLQPFTGNTAILDSTVWILDNQSNLKKWKPDTDSFETIIPGVKSLTSSGKPDTIRSISKARNNRLLINSDHTFHVYDAPKQEFIKSYVRSEGKVGGMAAGKIMSAAEDEMGHYWLMHRGGNLTSIHPGTNQIQAYEYGKEQLAFPGMPESPLDAFTMSHQNKNGIWFQLFLSATYRSTFLYFDFVSGKFFFYDHEFNFPGNKLSPYYTIPYKFMEDQTGLLWLHTRPGMYKQSPKKRQMELYRHYADSPGSLPSDSINYLFEDSKERLWIGTRRGLALYQPNSDNFRVFRNDPENATTISNNNITAIIEDEDEKIWVGTRNGLNQWQESTGHFKRFFYSPKETNNCLTLFTDKEHRLWLSVRNKGVFILDKSSGKILKSYIPDINNSTAITTTEISTIYQDYSGNMWLGTSSRTNTMAGLFRLNQAEDGFFHYLPNPSDSSSISDRAIFFIAEDGKKRLWIGANLGLNLYDPDKDCFIVFNSNTINCMTGFCADKNGEPWFGTYSGSGLVSFDRQNGIINAYGEAQGLLHNDISLYPDCRITVDDFGRFWLPTQRGLSVFDPETKTFVSYFEKDGFQPYDIGYFTIKSRNGYIWIGSSKGLNRIVPAELMKKDTTLPLIVITQVTILDSLYSIPDGKIFKKSVAYTDGFELRHWQKDISFDFLALHYLRPEDNLYSWKLENYDKNWSVPSKERKASYTNLSPGDYVFRVKASNADGVWNEEGVSIAMTILPPWWQTWWAYIAYVLLFIFGLRSYSFWRLRHLRLEKEHLQVKVDERTRELNQSLENLRSTQSQLIHSEKMASLGQLTAGIAHEIQNPLNFVNNFSEVNKELLEELKDELAEGSKQYAVGNMQSGMEKLKLAEEIANDVIGNEQKINHHGKRADAIVKGMLQHSRTSTGQKELTDINKLADEYLRLSYHGLRAKDKSFNADFKTEFDPNLPKINVIPQDIGRVLLNLVNNAFYACAERSKLFQSSELWKSYQPLVTVSTVKLNDKLQISVKDNGPGIPPEIVDKIFQPFFTTKPTGQGTGLGLSLAYDIVKAHGGEIKVESKEEEGSEFIIQIPNH